MFERISVGIKTILRDSKLYQVIESLRSYPNIHMIIADDGNNHLNEKKFNLYQELSKEGHFIQRTSYDAGFGAKSNLIASLVRRPYLLVASDDFDFSDSKTKEGILKLQDILDNEPSIDIASGRVNNNPYEFNLIDCGHTIVEETVIPEPPFTVCDLTVNYSLIKREVFEKVRWDEDQKIGNGEHGSFFVDVKRAGFKVGYVPGVNINTLEGQDSAEYRKLRNRARSPERSCFDKRGIKKYFLGNGQVDYDVDARR